MGLLGGNFIVSRGRFGYEKKVLVFRIYIKIIESYKWCV